MPKKVYSESAKKWIIGLGGSGGTLIGAIFLYLYLTGAIEVTGYSEDVICDGTPDDPCVALINFTANDDIFVYPTDYDPWGRSVGFDFDPNVKQVTVYRRWGKSWRKYNLEEPCIFTWCGAKSAYAYSNKYSLAWRRGKDYEIKIEALKHDPNDDIAFAPFGEDIVINWYGLNITNEGYWTAGKFVPWVTSNRGCFRSGLDICCYLIRDGYSSNRAEQMYCNDVEGESCKCFHVKTFVEINKGRTDFEEVELI